MAHGELNLPVLKLTAVSYDGVSEIGQGVLEPLLSNNNKHQVAQK